MNKKSIFSFLLAAVLLSAFGCASSAKIETSTNGAAENSSSFGQNGANESLSELGNAMSDGSQETQQSQPDAVVKDLYKTREQDFARSTDRIMGGKNRTYIDKYFDKTLADYFWKDLTTHTGEVGVLDFDPFYNAQDADIKNLKIGQPKIEGDRATVVVTFENYDRKDTLIYSLVRQKNAQWKISDIKYTDGSSLVGYFKEDEKNRKNTSGEENFFSGTYKVGSTTCTVKPIKMAFEIKWAKGSGTMNFYFDGDENTYKYVSDDTGKGVDAFVFDDASLTTGKFIRADGTIMPVSKIK